jgi:dihydrofolate reductase
MTRTERQNSGVMKGDVGRVVARLKKEPGNDIIADGGPSVVQEFIQRGLADDYQIAVLPVRLLEFTSIS